MAFITHWRLGPRLLEASDTVADEGLPDSGRMSSSWFWCCGDIDGFLALVSLFPWWIWQYFQPGRLYYQDLVVKVS